jgi:hypothetical protein
MMASNPDTNVIDKWVGDTLYNPKNKRPCGLTGTINERIDACSYFSNTASYRMSLVTRTEKGHEVYLDESFNVLISDRVDGMVNYETAKAACNTNQAAMGGLFTGIKWRLPAIEEFERNSQTYIFALPNMSYYSSPLQYWTSSVKGRSVFVFNGQDGTVGQNFFKGTRTGGVRCFADVK